MTSRLVAPPGNLKERIAALQQRSTSPQPPQTQTGSKSSSPTSPHGSLRDKIAKFEEKGGVPVPRGSFGLGAPLASADGATRRRGELYGNRIPSVGLGHPTGTSVGHTARTSSLSVDFASSARKRCISTSAIDFDAEEALEEEKAPERLPSSASSATFVNIPTTSPRRNSVAAAGRRSVSDVCIHFDAPIATFNHDSIEESGDRNNPFDRTGSPIIIISPEPISDATTVEKEDMLPSDRFISEPEDIEEKSGGVALEGRGIQDEEPNVKEVEAYATPRLLPEPPSSTEGETQNLGDDVTYPVDPVAGAPSFTDISSESPVQRGLDGEQLQRYMLEKPSLAVPSSEALESLPLSEAAAPCVDGPSSMDTVLSTSDSLSSPVVSDDIVENIPETVAAAEPSSVVNDDTYPQHGRFASELLQTLNSPPTDPGVDGSIVALPQEPMAAPLAVSPSISNMDDNSQPSQESNLVSTTVVNVEATATHALTSNEDPPRGTPEDDVFESSLEVQWEKPSEVASSPLAADYGADKGSSSSSMGIKAVVQPPCIIYASEETDKAYANLQLAEETVPRSPEDMLTTATMSPVSFDRTNDPSPVAPDVSQLEESEEKSRSSASTTAAISRVHSRHVSSRHGRTPVPITIAPEPSIEYSEPSIAPKAAPKSFSAVVHSRRTQDISEPGFTPETETGMESHSIHHAQTAVGAHAQVITIHPRLTSKTEPVSPNSPDLFALVAQAARLEQQLLGIDEPTHTASEPMKPIESNSSPAFIATAAKETTPSVDDAVDYKMSPPSLPHPKAGAVDTADVPPTPPPKSSLWRNTFHGASRSPSRRERMPGSYPRNSSSSEKSSEDSTLVATPPSPTFDYMKLEGLMPPSDDSPNSTSNSFGLSPKSARRKAIARSNTFVNRILSRGSRSSVSLALSNDNVREVNRPPSPAPSLPPLSMSRDAREGNLQRSPSPSSRPPSMISVTSSGSLFTPGLDRDIFDAFPTVPQSMPSHSQTPRSVPPLPSKSPLPGQITHPSSTRTSTSSFSSAQSHKPVRFNSQSKKLPGLPPGWFDDDDKEDNSEEAHWVNLVVSSHNP